MKIAFRHCMAGAFALSALGFLYAVGFFGKREFGVLALFNFGPKTWSNVDDYYSEVTSLLDDRGENAVIPPFRRSSLNQKILSTKCVDTLPTIHHQAIRICTYLEDNWGKAIKMHEVVSFEKAIVKRMFDSILPRYPGVAFLDLGSFIGVYGLTAAAMGRQVFAFEPDRGTIDLLSTTAKLNDISNFNFFPFAMGKSRGCIVTKMQEENHFAMTFAFDASCGSEGSVTPVINLDYLIETLHYHGVKRAIMKIDVERYEPYVIIGAKRFLSEIDVPVIQMEWRHMRPLLDQEMGEPNRADVKEMIRILTTLGYKPFDQNTEQFTQDRVLDTGYAIEWTDDVYWVKL